MMMGDITKLPKWARDEIQTRDREIRRLEAAVETLRRETAIEDSVGTVLLGGYGDEPLPLGPYFRLQCRGIEVTVGDKGKVNVSAPEGAVIVRPLVSNVIQVGVAPL